MTYYKDYNYNQIMDRSDLQYSPYVAALDIQYAHNVPYLWSFMIDSTEEIAFGRSFEDLLDFLETLKKRMHLSNADKREHYLVIIVEDLFAFFARTKKILPYDPEPCVSKSGSDVLLCSVMGAYHIHSYKAYFETDLADDMLNNSGIVTPEIDPELLSGCCELSQDELDNSENRVIYMCCAMRQEIDMKYQGLVDRLPLTYTARVERLIAAEQRRQSNKANCNIQAQIIKKNPIASERGREYILPLLYKAFMGGSVFFEEGVPDKPFADVWSVDMTSAYIARMVLSRYPVGEFRELPQPKSYKELLKKPYSCYAMLITFVVEDVELRPGGLAFLPSQLRTHYLDVDDQVEIDDQIQRATSTRIRSAKRLRMTLTDVDFTLFLQNYKPKRIKLLNILGARYGYLPDYVINVIVQLYGGKAKSKRQLAELEKVGEVPLDVKIDYERIKSTIARLYGIFTKKPIVERYVYDRDKKDLVVADKNYISPTAKYSPVLYQWGVWTTALVRKEISELRRQLVELPPDRGIRVLSGDTDNINYIGDATDIIAQYNDNVKLQIQRRSDALGIEPELLQDLGSLTIKKYKRYKLTGLKQYCFIRESDKGDIFETRVGGMSKKCKYFEDNFKSPDQMLDHFGLGLTIPASYAPRIVKIPISRTKVEEWEDRDGNRCSVQIESYLAEINTRFTLYPSLDPSPLGNPVKPEESPTTVEELEHYARQICNPIYNPLHYINKRSGKK